MIPVYSWHFNSNSEMAMSKVPIWHQKIKTKSRWTSIILKWCYFYSGKFSNVFKSWPLSWFFFQEQKRENITKIENKASLHKVEHGLFKQQFSHFPMNINSIANQTCNKKREIQYTLKVENKVRGEALAKRLSLGNRDSKSNLCFLSVGILIKKPNTSGFYF